MVDVRHSGLAAADLVEILADLEETNPAAANRYADLFAEKAGMLARFPEIGRSRPEIGPDVRSTLVKPTSCSTAIGTTLCRCFASCTVAVI